ncbi:MAG: hypothetical protein R3F29_10770 [Planctomycetota bacterium]
MRNPARHRSLLVGPLALAAAAALPAQNPDSRSVFAGAATAITVDGGLGALAQDATTLVHRPGFSQTAPVTMPAVPNAPDLRAILTLHGAPPGLDIDDFSSGRDDLLLDHDGVLEVPNDLWSVWSFSMAPTAAGQPGSRIALEASTGNVGSALFTWILPGSNLPAELIGVTERSHSYRDLGLNTPNPNVDGIDLPLLLGVDMGLATVGPNLAIEPGWGALLPTTKRIFFTVSHATRNLVPASWWGSTLPSGATILSVRTSSLTAGWAQPSVFRSYSQLGLGQNEDIDALAVDLARQKVLFSCVGNARDQLLYYDMITDGGAPHTVVKTDGTPVSDAVGKLQTDDIDAVCTLDPHLGDLGDLPVGGHAFGSTCGAPRSGLLGLPRMSGSAYRRYEAGSIRFQTFLSGWPATGPTPSLAFCFMTTGNNLDPVLISGVHVRDTSEAIVGDPQTATIAVPAALALTSQPVTFRWFTLDWNTGALDEAWPVQVWL